MGNKNSIDDFTNLEEKIKEKSLYSYNIILKDRKEKINSKIDTNTHLKNLQTNSKIKGIECKLKLYPSKLTLKNENMVLNFKYCDIQCWAHFPKLRRSSSNLFYFETLKETYYCKPLDNTTKEVVNSLKEICQNICNQNRNKFK